MVVYDYSNAKSGKTESLTALIAKQRNAYPSTAA